MTSLTTFKDQRGKFRWRLTRGGRNVVTSDGYEKRATMMRVLNNTIEDFQARDFSRHDETKPELPV